MGSFQRGSRDPKARSPSEDLRGRVWPGLWEGLSRTQGGAWRWWGDWRPQGGELSRGRAWGGGAVCPQGHGTGGGRRSGLGTQRHWLPGERQALLGLGMEENPRGWSECRCREQTGAGRPAPMRWLWGPLGPSPEWSGSAWLRPGSWAPREICTEQTDPGSGRECPVMGEEGAQVPPAPGQIQGLQLVPPQTGCPLRSKCRPVSLRMAGGPVPAPWQEARPDPQARDGRLGGDRWPGLGACARGPPGDPPLLPGVLAAGKHGQRMSSSGSSRHTEVPHVKLLYFSLNNRTVECRADLASSFLAAHGLKIK